MLKLRLLCLLAFPALLCGETGYNAWLRYAPLDRPVPVPAVVSTLDDSILIASARQELIRGVQGMLGRTLRVETGEPTEPAIVLRSDETAPLDAYWLRTTTTGPFRCLVVSGTSRGVLYGVFALLRKKIGR